MYDEMSDAEYDEFKATMTIIPRDAGQSAHALVASAGDKLEPTPDSSDGSDSSERYPGRGANGYVSFSVHMGFSKKKSLGEVVGLTFLVKVP